MKSPHRTAQVLINNEDNSSLGDWFVNTEKLPHGLKNLADEVHKRGLKFGLWVEPEMTNFDSELYRAHPDWILHVPDYKPSSTPIYSWTL